jgi:phenylpropionate dioxygenase-like ring-hydroxylating dioxygenase large terminal subunit
MHTGLQHDPEASDEQSKGVLDESAFDWRNCWYPVSFVEDLPKGRPTGFTLYDTPLVLFFDDMGRVVCLRDRCAHRAARLSNGQIVNGRLECLYHGWQFGAGGRCLHIPQLLAGREIPERAHVRSYPTAVLQEIVWIWAGDPDRADQALIPKIPQADDASTRSVTFQMDLPYDQGYLIENVIDVAHIHIAHHGVRGGGLREAAKPLQFNIVESSMAGIRSTFQSVGLVRAEDSPALSGAEVEFVAPNLVRYVSKYSNPDLAAGLELFSLPLGKDQCRLLYRKYSNFTPFWDRLTPRWMEHLSQCRILEQDMAVVVGQSEEIERDGASLSNIWMPLRTSDRLVVEYRKWLDRYGKDLPYYRGFTTSREKLAGPSTVRPPIDRHVLHTRVCSTCSRVYRTADRTINVLWILISAAAAMAIGAESVTATVAFILVALVGLCALVAARRFKSCF